MAAIRMLAARIMVSRGSWLRWQSTDISYPKYTPRTGEDETVKRKRLLYQSRKRGMTENGILLSTFAERYLNKFTSQQLEEYDKLINEPSNDWDIYQWITKKEIPPLEYQTPTLSLLQEHTATLNANSTHVQTQPPLNE
ncbi:PREDICTED: succinate dehydrogenase assembly factor 2, mitochondrial-like [Amphimedon queenslandica]|uniref:Succinate dehydrogenase assembly factor 2, mitochondrial n=1 Tax=Amphimedon queenslandica TaxID=400682 RepID=A0A1X7VG91_AMPQE|nr:PREDICTED: succinate dehydrogenase assembly factor 2, mitochondrial-like [Amphimedon queenslandica]|eukprot:XP_003384506.1 PREDICTED: succinate dehydrogenase assembly factor 2, mitochondrial-like [Amphimedon queenslandica]